MISINENAKVITERQDIQFVTEEMLNEASVIPVNFSWRAGIGTQAAPGANVPPADPASTCGFSPFSKSFEPMQSYKMPQGMSPAEYANPGDKYKGQMEFNQTLLYEIDANLTDISEQYKFEPMDNKTWAALKQDMRNYLAKTANKYKANISDKFLELLYNTCLQAYTTTWVMKCGEAKVQDVSTPEYIYNFDTNEMTVNPFTIYSLFASAVKGTTQPVYEYITEDIKNHMQNNEIYQINS